MAVSLTATGIFSGASPLYAQEESGRFETETYVQEDLTEESSKPVILSETAAETTVQETILQETAAEEKTATETDEAKQLSTQEADFQETTTEIVQETLFEETSFEEIEGSSSENVSEVYLEEETSEEPEETCEDQSYESYEEESYEDESEEEFSQEVEGCDIMPLDLGDVTQIVEITSCRIEGGKVVVKGKINQQFKTEDENLYLFEESMYQKNISSSPISQTKQKENFEFSVPLNDNTAQSRLYSKFFVGIKFKDGTYYALSDGAFITNPEALAQNQSAYPQARSKKGLFTEVTFGTDIDELGLSYTNVNIVMNLLLGGSGYSYTYNGKTYQYSAGYIESLDETIQLYQRNNIIVNAVLLWQPDGNAHSFGYPGANASIGAYHGWNVVSEEGIECVSAALHFLGERYGRSDNAYGHIASWTVGNEVNADTSWNYTGHQPANEYAYIYTNMLRITNQAVKSSCAHARVFMSLDMFWYGVSGGSRYDGKEMIDYVNTYMKAEGDIEWGVAFHPYANPLTEVEWWNDNASFNENATFISMQNISVLTGYLCKNGLRNPDGSVKHVILSEQGYTSHSSNQGNVEWKQAAAYAYAYYVTEANPYIDAFIAMREIDAKPETDAGIHQGLWYNDENKGLCTFAKKPAWTVWKYIDTDQSFSYTDSLAPLVGLSSFSSIYGSVMAAKNRSVDLGTGGYAVSCDAGNSLQSGWYGEYGLTSCSADNEKVSVKAQSNSPFTYAGIARTGNVDFSVQRYFCFQISGTAGASQNLRVRMRFTSGQDVLETEISLEKNKTQMIYADLGNWKGKSSISKIQIWVQQDGIEVWENGSFVITNICQSSNISTEKTRTICITESGYTDVTANGFSAYCKTNGTNPAVRVEYSAWNIAASTESLVTKQASVTNGYSECSFSISEFGGKRGAYAVRMVAYDKDNVASEPALVSVTVKGVSEALVIYNSYITDLSYTGFTVTVEAASDYGLSSNSQIAVWSSSAGQANSLVWYPLHFSNGKASVRVNISNHGGWTGEYYCHAYVVDNMGTKKLYANTASVLSPNPQITEASVTEVGSLGYRINVNLNCPLGVSYAQVKTWNEKNGEKSAVITSMTLNGSSAYAYILTSDHKGIGGSYHSVVYLYDKAGNCTTRTLDVQVPEDLNKWERKPTITASYTQTGTNSYRILFQFRSYLGCKAVRIATWTEENGQDDLIWRDVSFNASSNSGYIDLPANDKKGGPYINDIYIWDQAGQSAGYRVVVSMPSKMPKIVKITISDVSSKGYRVTAQFEASKGVSKVMMPTWTENNGQDDLVWHQASVSQNTSTCYIEASKHKNESGVYITHIYVYDAEGDYALEGIEIVLDQGSQSGYTGLLLRDGKWKYYQNGVVDEDYVGLACGKGSWYYVENAKINWNYTGLTYYKGKWYYIQNGAVDWFYTGLTCYEGSWYYIRNGSLDWNYTGLCMYNKAWYYIKNGKVDWNYTGPCLYNGTYYYVEKGVLNWAYDMSSYYGAKIYASVLVEADTSSQEEEAAAEESLRLLEEEESENAQTVLYQAKQNVSDIAVQTAESENKIEISWLAIIVRTIISYIREYIGM